jgi:hypothetical protein
MTQVSESDYRIAQESKDPRVRQEFLDAIDLEDAGKFVRRVIYDTGKMGDTLAYVNTLESVIPRIKSKIHVLPELFELPHNEMLSVIIDHEGHHAKQGYYHGALPQLLGISFSISPCQKAINYMCINEATAINNELLNVEKRRLPSGTITYRTLKIAQTLLVCTYNIVKLNEEIQKNLFGSPKCQKLQEILEKGAENFLREYSDEWQNEKQIQPMRLFD